MAIVNFSFTDINVHREHRARGKVSISTKFNIDSVEPYALNVGKASQAGLLFRFSQRTEYKNLGDIALKGHILYLSEEEKINEILEMWKKEKKIKKDVFEHLANKVIEKCSIQSVVLSDTVGLPPAIRLDKIKVK